MNLVLIMGTPHTENIVKDSRPPEVNYESNKLKVLLVCKLLAHIVMLVNHNFCFQIARGLLRNLVQVICWFLQSTGPCTTMLSTFLWFAEALQLKLPWFPPSCPSVVLPYNLTKLVCLQIYSCKLCADLKLNSFSKSQPTPLKQFSQVVENNIYIWHDIWFPGLYAITKPLQSWWANI